MCSFALSSLVLLAESSCCFVLFVVLLMGSTFTSTCLVLFLGGCGFVLFKCLGYFDVCEPCTPFPDLAAAAADLVVQSQSISGELKSPPTTGSL